MTQPTLFDQPAVNVPLANKIESFYSKDTQVKRLFQKERILIMIKDSGPATQRGISEKTGIARHLIPDRLLILQKENRVKICGAIIDNLTNREVTVYEAI
jgi:hypothetical protein